MEFCVFVLRHLPGLSPSAWGKPWATRWPPWRCLPGAAWLRSVDGRLLPHTSVTATAGSSSKPTRGERREERGRGGGGREDRERKMGHISQDLGLATWDNVCPHYQRLLHMTQAERVNKGSAKIYIRGGRSARLITFSAKSSWNQ